MSKKSDLIQGVDYDKEQVNVCTLCHNTTVCISYFKTDFPEDIMQAMGIEGRYGNFYCKHSCWHIIKRLMALDSWP